jgi:hypothetical protein
MKRPALAAKLCSNFSAGVGASYLGNVVAAHNSTAKVKITGPASKT